MVGTLDQASVDDLEGQKWVLADTCLDFTRIAVAKKALWHGSMTHTQARSVHMSLTQYVVHFGCNGAAFRGQLDRDGHQPVELVVVSRPGAITEQLSVALATVRQPSTGLPLLPCQHAERPAASRRH